MKRLFILVLFLSLVFFSSPASAAEIQATFVVGSCSANINGNNIVMEVAPFIKDGRTYLPLVYVAQAMGMDGKCVGGNEKDIKWNEKTQEVTLIKNYRYMIFKIGSDYVKLQGFGFKESERNVLIKIDAAPIIVDGRTCLPISVVAKTYRSVVLWDDATKKVTIYDGKYLTPSHNVQSDDQEIVDLANKITKGLDSDMEKSRAIHDWIVDNIHYDLASYNTDALEVLQEKSGVCEGYSTLNAALHRAVGLEAKVVHGLAFTNRTGSWENHAWNEVYLDNRWVIEDVTWDDVFRKIDKYKYFDPSAATFAIDHEKEKDRDDL